MMLCIIMKFEFEEFVDLIWNIMLESYYKYE